MADSRVHAKNVGVDGGRTAEGGVAVGVAAGAGEVSVLVSDGAWHQDVDGTVRRRVRRGRDNSIGTFLVLGGGRSGASVQLRD